MKEKQGNKPNSYGKLMKRMLIYLGIGGGFFLIIFSPAPHGIHDWL